VCHDRSTVCLLSRDDSTRIRAHASHHPDSIATHRRHANYVLETQGCMHHRNRNKLCSALHLIGLNYTPHSNVPYKYLEQKKV